MLLYSIWTASWHDKCKSHVISTATSQAFEPIKDTLGYQVAYSLSQVMAGQLDKLRKAVCEVIEAMSYFVEACPPVNGVFMEHRDRILNLFIPRTRAGKKRMVALKHKLCFDIQRIRIPIYYIGRRPQKHKWCWALAKLLLPSKVPVLKRQRWLTSLTPVSETSLLFEVCGIARFALPRFVLLLKGKTLPPLDLHVDEMEDIGGNFDAADLDRDFNLNPAGNTRAVYHPHLIRQGRQKG